MDYETYQKAFFVEPQPEPRFAYNGISGVTLYIEDYEQAVAFYTGVLGPPAYVEGPWTRGWRLGDTWLTLLKGAGGGPANVEIAITVATPAEADRLHATLLAAGAQGVAPSDEIMYEPLRYGMATDPFGATWLIVSPLP